MLRIISILAILFFTCSCKNTSPKIEYRHYKIKVECQGIDDRILYEMTCNKPVCFAWYQDESGMRVIIPKEICIMTVLEEYTKEEGIHE